MKTWKKSAKTGVAATLLAVSVFCTFAPVQAAELALYLRDHEVTSGKGAIMKKVIVVLVSIAMLLLGAACGAETPAKKATTAEPKAQTDANTKEADGKETAAKSTAAGPIRLKITAKGKTLTAVMENNPTVQAFAKKLPVTLKMENLYNREMCYHYGNGAFPTGALRSDRYEVGDIIYWPPRGSFVILYLQNGEEFERQHMGRISGNVDFFRNAGDVDVTFEILK